MPTFEAEQYIYIYQPMRSILASKTVKVVIESYNKLISKLFRPYKTLTINYNTLAILQDKNENTNSTDRATEAPSFREKADTSRDTKNAREPSQTQKNKSNDRDNGQSDVGKLVRHVTEVLT